MEHLSLQVLGRLVDDSPTAEELDHLERCRLCAAELKALRGQTAALAGLPDVRPPRGDWESLEGRLVTEGLVEAAALPALPVPPSAPARPARARWIRTAASVALFAAGAAAGAGAMAGGIPARAVEADPDAAPAARVGNTTDPGAALAQMLDAERTYIDALAHYRQLVGAQGADDVAGDPRVRYAALEDLVRAGQAALSQAPADPFLNGLLASTLAEREAVSRRLSGAEAGQDGWF